MKNPRVSIITPSYNQGEFLEETILSVGGQSYGDVELVVIDGGSTDNSVEIIQNHAQHINYWVSEKDRGQAHAINKGLAQCSGEIVTWINSDDTLIPGAIEQVVQAFQQLPDRVGVIHGGVEIFNQEGVQSVDYGYPNPGLERYLSGMAFSQPGAFMRKYFLDQVGLVDERYHYGMDYDLFARLALVCDFHPIDEVLSRYRLHNDSKTVRDGSLFIEDWIKIFNRIVGKLELDQVAQTLKLLDLNAPADDGESPNDQFGTIDNQKLVFYFLCYVLKSDYRTSNWARARRVRSYLMENYSAEVIGEEKGISSIIGRMKMPGSAIDLGRKIKTYFE